jgi:transposase
VTTKESAELTRANKRIRELEMEVEILRRASKILGKDAPHPKGSTR